ncbi:TPA: hypothetical protein N0F65_008111 [Lagenidium giganteum]|uniref:Uncharacterized protein n=1 Tax=Lagenidium giganteum TaxID=4803 RepID=A0AAV2Z0W4_9STRA|nr:TPA: hypothetical protein N0F65_008111 [Lagenidium giganteum]
MPQERKSVVQHDPGGQKRVYIKVASGRGRMRSEWVTWLHKESMEAFGRLKMINGLILQAPGRFYATRPVQRFCERVKYVPRHQSGKLRVTIAKEEATEKEVATHLGKMKRLFERGILEDDMMTNMGETHMLINMDNDVCLAFKGQETVSYQDVVSGGQGMTLVVKLRGGFNACLEPLMKIFQNANCSYPIRDVPDNRPSIIGLDRKGGASGGMPGMPKISQ